MRAALVDLQQHLSKAGLPEALCGTVEIVLAEALNNIVEHASAGTPFGQMSIDVVQTPNCLAFEVCDNGQPLPGLKVPHGVLPESDGPFQDLPEGGFGWFPIHQMASALHYDRGKVENRLYFVIETNNTA